MSLGIRTIWRTRAISPAGSLVPRESVASPSLLPLRLSITDNLTYSRCAPIPLTRRFASNVVRTRTDTSGQRGDQQEKLHPTATAAPAKATFAERLALTPVRPHDADSILIRSRMEYPNERERRLHEHLRRREADAQTRHEAIARARHDVIPDWRSILQQLTAMTPPNLKGVVTVLLPERARYSLLNPDAENSLWDIRSRTRCHMVLEQELDARGNTVLKISGTRTAVEQAIDDIVQVARKARVLFVSDAGETLIHDGTGAGADTELTDAGRTISIGQTRSLDRDLQPGVLSTTATDVPKPLHWTKQTFEQYVATLTRGFLPVWQANALYPGRKATHQKDVLKQLVDIFYDPETKPVLSGAAFKIAFEYIARKGRTARPQARVLFDRMERLGIPTDTTVFNLLMEATVHDRELGSFSTCLHLMGRHGHEPNLKTWLLFLRLVQSEEVRRYILQAMIHKNLLVSPENKAQVAYEMASYDAERAMLYNLDVPALLAEQNALYGPGWLDFSLATPTCNKILEVIAKHGRWDQVNEFITFMASRPPRRGYPDENTCNICLERARVQTYAKTAIELLERFETLGVRAEMGSVRSLFLAFWHHNMAHCMDTVWQFALLTGRTSVEMATRVADVLNLSSDQGWDRRPLPEARCDSESSIPVNVDRKKMAKQYGLYVLLMTGARDLFGVADPQRQPRLLQTLRYRGLEMRSRGHVVPRGELSRALREAAEKDLRFHKSLVNKRWAVEPNLLRTEIRVDRAHSRRAAEEFGVEEVDEDVVPDEREPEVEQLVVEDRQNIEI